MRTRLNFLTAAFVMTLSTGAWTGSLKGARTSCSVGSPTEGHLVGGVHLPDAPYLRVLPRCKEGDERWGTKSLVDLIDRAAKATARDFPGSKTTVGDLSRREGGEIDGHASHESGRDVDVLFFSRDSKGKVVYHDDFVAYRADGTPKNGGDFRFDDARTWSFVKHLITDPSVRVSRIFIASHMRARLLHYARTAGEPIAIRDRAEATMVEPAGVLPHDDHLHVRISCPPDAAGCVESAAPRKRVPVRHERAHGQTPRSRASSTPVGHASTPTRPAPSVEPEKDVEASTPSDDPG